jgi:hypothetical protein
MNRGDIIRMAREAGMHFQDDVADPWTATPDELTRFAELVAAAEREGCVEACREEEKRSNFGHEGCLAISNCIVAIEAMGQQ